MSSNESNTDAPTRFRTADLTAIAGLISIVTGMLLFKSGAEYLPAWMAWLVAPLLWYLGFAVMVGWAATRMFAGSDRRAENARKEAATEPARPTQAPILASVDFAEHDCLL